MVWPSGVEMVPALRTFGPTSAMRPPTWSGVVGLVSDAPFCTTTSPLCPLGVSAAGGAKAGVPLLPALMGSEEKRNCASGLLSRPRATRLSLIGSDEATSACVFTCDAPPKMMPF